MKKPLLLFGALGALAVIAAAWYLISPLFINKTVDEKFPAQLPTPQELAKMSQDKIREIKQETMNAAAKMPPKIVQEPMPFSPKSSVSNDSAPSKPQPQTEQPKALSQGEFKGIDSFHTGSGKAAIFTLPNGSSIVRLENFSVVNGPDLHVLLSGNTSPTNKEELESNGSIDLGGLKGNKGNQNYDIPPNADITKYKSVVIYCKPFHVVFAAADLK